MATSPQPAFTVDAAVTAAFDNVTSAVALPGTPASDTVVRLVNVSTRTVYVALGTSAVTVTANTGLAIAPGQVATYLGLAGQTHIAGITSGASFYGTAGIPNGVLNIATGN